MSSVLIKDTQGKKAVPLDAQLLSERDVYLTGEINEEMLVDFHGRMLTLKRADKEKSVRVWLTSGGGDLNVALAIIDIISSIGLKIDVIGYSSVYSAGALILAAGQNKRRYCLPNTEIMIHQIIDFMKRPSILFLKIADVDESNYTLANFMINYFINRLYKYSDMQEDGRGKIPVKIVLEDYASGIFFQNLYRYICTGRERMVSFTIVVQSLAQLEACHAENAKTILSNIDYWVVFSTTEITTARELLSQRLEIPLAEALAFPINKVAVFVRGRSPIITERYDITEHKKYDDWMSTERNARHKA
ncbi:MAG: ATP-dependent Clp protease proteolytic subunit [Lachnospiraceae bacterium]|nr:ATP-dependent Clp protease proteolytic subunit [Lachnospiraceae bacterium]